MNERINELVLKARGQATSDSKDGGKCFDLDLFHEKFAELIVRECAEVCAKQSLHYAEHHNPGSAASAADACRILIKQHFGIQ